MPCIYLCILYTISCIYLCILYTISCIYPCGLYPVYYTLYLPLYSVSTSASCIVCILYPISTSVSCIYLCILYIPLYPPAWSRCSWRRLWGRWCKRTRPWRWRLQHRPAPTQEASVNRQFVLKSALLRIAINLFRNMKICAKLQNFPKFWSTLYERHKVSLKDMLMGSVKRTPPQKKNAFCPSPYFSNFAVFYYTDIVTFFKWMQNIFITF